MVTKKDLAAIEARIGNLERNVDLYRQRLIATETALETEKEWRRALEERLKAYEVQAEAQRKAGADAEDYKGLIDEWLNGSKEERNGTR